jgi:acyl-CoA reductase-like NAD-dependent aldehyde dehydrogenase
MEFASDGPMAIPMWVNGHAFLTVTKDFFTVTNPQTGEAIRRVPLCGASEAAEAVQAAQAAQPAGPTWACRRAASAWASWPMNSTATPATSPSC